MEGVKIVNQNEISPIVRPPQNNEQYVTPVDPINRNTNLHTNPIVITPYLNS